MVGLGWYPCCRLMHKDILQYAFTVLLYFIVYYTGLILTYSPNSTRSKHTIKTEGLVIDLVKIKSHL